MGKLTVETRLASKLSLTERRWLSWACVVAASELPKSVREAHLSVTICGDQRMRTLNRTHRGKDKTTDVLSFPAQLSVREGDIEWAAPGVLPLGDLIISLPVARKQARQFKLRLAEELVHLFFHGYLHLLGYDHEISAEQELLMQKRELKLLQKFKRKVVSYRNRLK